MNRSALMKTLSICLLSLLIPNMSPFLMPKTLGVVDVSARTVTTEKLKIAFAESGEVNLYDKMGSNWREITPKPYGVGKTFLNNTDFGPWNDGTMSFVSSEIYGDGLKITYRQNLSLAGDGFVNWFLLWETYARGSYDDTIETWVKWKVDNGTISKIDVTYPFLGISLGNGLETYYEGTLYSPGTHHKDSYPNQMSIPMVELVNKENKTALYITYFNNTKGRFSYIDAEANWGIPTWTIMNDFAVKLARSVYLESTHVFFYSVTSFVDGYQLNTSYLKAVSWYANYLQPLLPPPMKLESLRSRSSNIWVDPYSEDWKTKIQTWKDYVSSIGLSLPYDNAGDLNPLNATRIKAVTDLAHLYGLPVGIELSIYIPTTSQLFINHAPEYFSRDNIICTGYPAARNYFYDKIAMWAGLGVDWIFVNGMQNDDSLDGNSAHDHESYFMAYNNLEFSSYLLDAINSNNTDSTPNFVWNDHASDIVADLGSLVVPTPDKWGASLNDFISNIIRVLYETNSTTYNLEPTWNGKTWDFNFELEHLISLATKIYPSWNEAGNSQRKDNIVKTISFFISQHKNLYENQPVVVIDDFPFFITRIGSGIENIIPINASTPYAGAVYSKDNNVAFTSATVGGGRDFVIVNKNLTNRVSTALRDGTYKVPLSLAPNETRLVWRRGQVAITKVENSYASDVFLNDEEFGFIMRSDYETDSAAQIYVSDKGKPDTVTVNNKEHSEGEVWSYNPDAGTVNVKIVNSSLTVVKLKWERDVTELVLDALPYAIVVLLTSVVVIFFVRKWKKRETRENVIFQASLVPPKDAHSFLRKFKSALAQYPLKRSK